MLLYNFVTGDYDDLPNGPTTDAEAKQYIKQFPPVLNLYDLERRSGRTILEALREVYLTQTRQARSQP